MVLTCIKHAAGHTNAENHIRGSVNGYSFLTLGYVRSQDVVVSGLIRSLIFAIIKIRFYFLAYSE